MQQIALPIPKRAFCDTVRFFLFFSLNFGFWLEKLGYIYIYTHTSYYPGGYQEPGSHKVNDRYIFLNEGNPFLTFTTFLLVFAVFRQDPICIPGTQMTLVLLEQKKHKSFELQSAPNLHREKKNKQKL